MSEDQFSTIMKAMSALEDKLSDKIDGMGYILNTKIEAFRKELKEDIANLEAKVDENSNRISSLETKTEDLGNQIEGNRKSMSSLETRFDDFETRNSREHALIVKLIEDRYSDCVKIS